MCNGFWGQSAQRAGRYVDGLGSSIERTSSERGRHGAARPAALTHSLTAAGSRSIVILRAGAGSRSIVKMRADGALAARVARAGETAHTWRFAARLQLAADLPNLTYIPTRLATRPESGSSEDQKAPRQDLLRWVGWSLDL